jgi:hypothetical protein
MRSNSINCFHFKKDKAKFDLRLKFKLQTKCKFSFFFPCGLKATKRERMKEGRILEVYLGSGTFLLDGLQHL